MTEAQQAEAIANKVLDRPNADPDDDMAVLARQLLRTREALTICHRGLGAVIGTADYYAAKAACEHINAYEGCAR